MKILIDDKEILNYIIKKLEIKFGVSNHCELILEMDLKEEINISFESDIKVDDFYAKVKKYRIINYGYQGVKLYVVAYSYTLLLDKQLKTRVYQDRNLTYSELVSNIMSNYKIKYIISTKLNKKISKIYLQDDISDFKFLCRILSDIKEGIFYSRYGILFFGFQYSSRIELNNILEKGICEIGEYYKVLEQAVYTGDVVNNSYVLTSKIVLNKGIYESTFKLAKENIGIKKIVPSIKGRFLSARVVEVNSLGGIAKMKVDFGEIDVGKSKTLFSFSTPYSKTMTSFYITPQIGDMVDVYFPSNNENDAKVAFCIDNEKSERFCDKNNRNFIIENLEILLSNGKMTFNLDNFNLISKQNVSIASKSDITFESIDDTSIYANGISLVSKKDNIELNSVKNILLKAMKIHNN